MQVSIPGFIVARPASSWEDIHFQGMSARFWACEAGDDSEYMTVCRHTLTFDIPEGFDSRPEQIKRLEAKQRDIDAKYAAASAMLRQQIASLRAIEHTEAA